jgi:hypothetical protein
MGSVIQFPSIDYNYWSNRNDAFSDSQLSGTIKIGLNIAKRGGLISNILEEADIKNNRMLVDLIAAKIQAYTEVNKFSDDELLIIFDLIQGWGGENGKDPLRQAASRSNSNDLATTRR